VDDDFGTFEEVFLRAAQTESVCHSCSALQFLVFSSFQISLSSHQIQGTRVSTRLTARRSLHRRLLNIAPSSSERPDARASVAPGDERKAPRCFLLSVLIAKTKSEFEFVVVLKKQKHF
jgi:hypothetical protein